MLTFLSMLYVQTCDFKVSTVFLSFAFAVCPTLLRAATTVYTPAPFSDYQPILDRMPFGALPPGFGQVAVDPVQTQTDAQLLAEQQKLAKQVNMSAVTITPNGATAIGFTDLSEKPPVSYYLLVGDSAGGWTVVNADYDEEWAQIEKEGVTITLQLGKGLIDAPPVASAAPVAPAATVAQAPAAAALTAADPALPAEEPPAIILRPSQIASVTPPEPSYPATEKAEMDLRRDEIAKIKESGGDLKSYLQRLRERKAQERADKETAEIAAREKLQELARKISQDELAKHERAINLDLIAQGAKPVSSIELSPEEEEALVDKGVLAP